MSVHVFFFLHNARRQFLHLSLENLRFYVSIRSVSHSLRIIDPSAVFSISLFFFPRVIEWLGERSVTLVLVQLYDCCLKTSFIQWKSISTISTLIYIYIYIVSFKIIKLNRYFSYDFSYNSPIYIYKTYKSRSNLLQSIRIRLN